MDIGRPTTATEARALISVVQYYRDMWPSQYHILSPLTEDIGPRGRKIIWNDALEDSFKEIKFMVSAESLLTCPY